MATKFDTAVVTAAGKELLQKVQQGLTTMQFTGFGLGSGEWEEAEIATATALKSVKNTYSISSATTDDNGNMTLKVLMVNAESGSSVVATEYEMTELGLYAKDGANNTVLYGLGIPSGTPDVMPVFDGSNLVQIEQTWTIPIGAATVTVDYSGAVALAADLQTAVTALNTHKAETVASQEGAHGIRYYDETLAVKVGDTWEEAASSGGSMVTVTTEEALLLNKTCTLVIGGTTYTETISAQGTCVFDGIKETGTATITANNGTSDVAETLSVPYYGEYTVELIDGVAMVINISTSESTLYGQSASITYGGNTKTVTLGADGTATTKIKYGSDGTMTVTATDGNQTATTNVAITSGTTTYSVGLAFFKTYTIRIDLTNSDPATWGTWLDDATGLTAVSAGGGENEVDELMGYYPCVLGTGGVEGGKLKTDDYSKYTDGTSVSDSDGDVMVKFPARGYKIVLDGNNLDVSITDGMNRDGYLYPTYKGSACEAVYHSAYEGYESSSKLRSWSGKTPTVNKTISQFRTLAQANGTGYEQRTFNELTYLQCCALIKYKGKNMQSALGRGYVDGNSASHATGTGNSKGLNFGEGTGKQLVKLFGIEDFWGNVYDFIDGIFSDASRNILTADGNFNDTGSGYTNRGSSGFASDTGGYFSRPKATNTYMGFVPDGAHASDGSSSTYWADSAYVSASRLAYFGGDWIIADYAGLFRLYVILSASYSNSSYSGRLTYFKVAS